MGTRPGKPSPTCRVSAPRGRQSYSQRIASARLFFRIFRTLRGEVFFFRAFRVFRGYFFSFSVFSFFCGSLFFLLTFDATAQDLTALETAIRTGTTEQKRDALFQIRNFRSEIASRSAIPALTDTDPIVRATAASAVTFLPKPEAITALSSLLADKDAFVRKETAYALGKVEHPDAAAPLIALLGRDRDLEVQAAAAFALGSSRNPLALDRLTRVLNQRPREENEFLRRSAARSIGQIAQSLRSGDTYVVTPQNFLPEKFKTLEGDEIARKHPEFKAAAGSLARVLRNKNESDDTRREAAFALGSIGNRDSITVLQTYINSPDPYLAEIAREALAKIAT